MAVVGTLVPVIIPYKAPPRDPRFPIGIWITKGIVSGDASGGGVSLQFDYTPKYIISLEDMSPAEITAPSSDQRYTLEWYLYDLPSRGDYFIIAGMGRIPTGYNFRSEGTFNILPFLQRVPLVDISRYILKVTFTTNTNGHSYLVYAWGFVWDRRSLLEDGGPQRPA